MNILFLCYWSVNNSLTISTVYEHLKILSQLDNIQSVIFVTIERDEKTEALFKLPLSKVIHVPMFSKNYKINLLNKIFDFLIFPALLKKIIKKYNIDKIIARGAPAGSLAYIVHKDIKIPFSVESFEPHADYMKDSGVWSGMGLKYIFEKYWEKKQIKYATALMPVTENYKKALIRLKVPEASLDVIPCCVHLNEFSFSHIQRSQIRRKFNITEENFVGIYVGKFGGLYYDNEAFKVFKRAFDMYEDNFRLIILSPDSSDTISQKLNLASINPAFVIVDFVSHSDIPKYLSAADFAFTLIKPTASMKYSSPIKNGEYWANGLPILSTENIGDDSTIIKNENGGALFSFKKNDMDSAFAKIQMITNDFDYRKKIQKIAEKYRNYSSTLRVYKRLYN